MKNYIRDLRALIGHKKFIHPAARVMILNDEEELLLIKRKDLDIWGMVAGAFEEGETIETCIKREAKEECGLTLHTVIPIGISTSPTIETITYPNEDIIQYFTMVFLCRDWSGDLLAESEEAKDIRFFPLDKLPKLPENEATSIPWLHQFNKTGQFILA